MAFQGLTIELPLGQQGFSGAENQSQMGPGHLDYVEGVDLEGGVVLKDGGAVKLNATALGTETSTKALLHFDGADTSTLILEGAAFPGRAWTAAGNAQLDTALQKFGSGSLLCDGTGDLVSTPDNAAFTIAAVAFMIDIHFNVNVAGNGTLRHIAGQVDAAAPTAAGSAWYLELTTGNVVVFGLSDGSTFTTVTGTTAITTAGWHRVRVLRTGNILRLYVDDVQEGGDVAFTGTVPDSAGALCVGARHAADANTWFGSLDEFRLFVGSSAAPTTQTVAFVVSGPGIGTPQPVRAGINFVHGGSAHDIVVLASGSVLHDSGSGTFNEELRAALVDSVEPPPQFVLGGGEAVGAASKLFMFSLGNQVQVIVGDSHTMLPLAAPPADWTNAFPICGCLHRNKMWGAGNATDPHRVYYSTDGDHQDFTGAGSGSLAVYPGEGTGITAMLSFRGLLVVWKYPTGIYTVDTRDSNVANWRVDRVTTAIGCAGPTCVVPIENDILYMDINANFHLLSATNDLGGVNVSNISQKHDLAPFIRTDVNLTNIRRSVGAWSTHHTEAWYFVPQAGASVNNLRMVVQFQNPQIGPRFFTYRRDVAISLWMRPSGDKITRPAVGDDVGFVWVLDQDARTKDGAAYVMELETASTDFGFADPSLAYKNKNGAFLEMVCDLIAPTIITVTPAWDDLPIDPIVFSLGTSSVGLDTFQLDLHPLGAGGTAVVRRKLPGSGRTLKLHVKNDRASDEVRIASMRVMFTVGDERTKQT